MLWTPGSAHLYFHVLFCSEWEAAQKQLSCYSQFYFLLSFMASEFRQAYMTYTNLIGIAIVSYSEETLALFLRALESWLSHRWVNLEAFLGCL